MTLYLGIDGGGSRTTAVVLDAGRQEIGRGTGGPCNIATGDSAALGESLREAAAGALAAAGLGGPVRFEGVCAGVAGYTARLRRAEFAGLLERTFPGARTRLRPDFAIAYWGATEGAPGIIVSAGTGAVVYGRSEAGAECRVDGRGFLLGDRGSGFDLGRWALGYALRRLDLGLEPDEMARRTLAAIGAEDADDLVEWVYRDFRPARIAALAEHVGSWARDGVPEARRFVASAGYALRTTAWRAMRRLGAPADTTPIYLLGGLWRIGPILIDAFREGHGGHTHPEMEAPPFGDIRQPLHDAAYGAALLAIEAEPGGPE